METKFIAGPCVIESAELLDAVAERLVAINRALGTDIIFKASFDKANRTSLSSFRGPGLEKGLQMLADVRAKWGLRLLTDIHEAWQAAPVGEVVDVIQIPAFLCRQTDLLVAAARTGRIVNIKKAQFLSGADMRYPYEKAFESAPAKSGSRSGATSTATTTWWSTSATSPTCCTLPARWLWTARTRYSVPERRAERRAATASSSPPWRWRPRPSVPTATSSRCIQTPTGPRATAPTCCRSANWRT